MKGENCFREVCWNYGKKIEVLVAERTRSSGTKSYSSAGKEKKHIDIKRKKVSEGHSPKKRKVMNERKS